MKSRQFLLEIERVRRPLELWRRTRKHRERIPESLWAGMAKLAKVYGVSSVSRVLRVGYYELERHVRANPHSGLAAPAQPAFVEVSPAFGGCESGCSIELQKQSGAKMTLRFEQADAVDALRLAEAFWRQGA